MADLLDILLTRRWEISGAVILIAIGAYFTGLNNRRNRFAIAAEKFYSTVLREFEGLYPEPTKWPKDNRIVNILREKAPRLASAVAEFRPHLNTIKRFCFYRAWLKYQKDYYDYEPSSGQGYNHGKYTSYDTTETYYKIFTHNVDSLLKFTNKR